MKNIYVTLISSDKSTLYTAYVLLKSNNPPSGILIATLEEKKNLKEYNRLIRKKYGIINTLSKLAWWPIYKFLDQRKDSILLDDLYGKLDYKSIEKLAMKLNIPILKLNSFRYGIKSGIDFISSIKPNFIVIHTPFWVSKKVRDLSSSKLVIGSHPGIVPHFRGASSSFWSRYYGKRNYNGYSIFYVNSGVDSGPLIKQKIIPYATEYSFIGNDYILLKMISEELINIVGEFGNGNIPIGIEQKNINSSQIYSGPNIVAYINFMIIECIRRYFPSFKMDE